MNFQPELAEKVINRDKTVTRRLVSDNPRSPWAAGDCKLNVGQSYAVCPGRGKHAIGRVIVSDVRLEQLGQVNDQEARREGFRDAEEFREAWAAINDGYDPRAQVWRVELFGAERKGAAAS
jgi:hypothetical protein